MSITFRKPFRTSAVPNSGNGAATPPDIPLGDQIVTITNTRKIRSKAGHDMMVIDLRTDAKEVGAVFLNLWHPNDVAKQIAAETLAHICRAAGLEEITSTNALHGARLGVRVSRDSQGYTQFNQWRDAR